MKMTVETGVKRTEKKRCAAATRAVRRFAPTLLCLALFPASFAVAANSGGYDDVPTMGDYGNALFPGGNTVTIDTDVTGNVYGGGANGGTVDNNRVTVTDGAEIGKSVFGASVTNGSATGNSVTIVDGTIGGTSSAGATVGTGDAVNNVASIEGGSAVSVYGAQVTRDGTATGNSMTMSGGTVRNYLAGAMLGKGDAIGNSLTMSGGSLTASNGGAYGARTYQGAATGNSMTVSGTASIASNAVAGMAAGGGVAENNTMIISGGKIGGHAYSGYSTNGSATGNHQVISGGDIKGRAYGGYSANGNATGNQVTVTGGIVGETVFGGSAVGSQDGFDVAATDNHVVSEGGSWGGAFGGYASGTTGNAVAEGNTVTVSGQELDDGSNVTGGWAYSRNGSASVSGNRVTIASDTTLPEYFKATGGYAEAEKTATASDNAVTVFVSEGAHEETHVYGGETNSSTGQAISNGNNVAVVLAGEAYRINGGGAYTDSTTEKAVASGNTVTVTGNGGSVSYVYGGQARAYDSGADDTESNGNRVILNDVDLVVDSDGNGGTAFGGYSDTGRADGNMVAMNGGSARYVQGGTTEYGKSASGNTVTVGGGTVSGSVLGGVARSGDGAAENNTVVITDGSAGRVYGGSANGAGNVSGNAVVLSGDASSVSGNMYGGYTADGMAAGNTVTVGAGTVSGWIYGGAAAGSGDATGNDVVLSGGSVTHVTGGYAGSGNASGNRVTVSGDGAVNGYIYGGYSESGTATGNTITVSRTSGMESAVLYGGYARSGGDAITGNVLNIETSHVEVRNIANFETVNLNIREIPASGNAILELTDTNRTDLGNTTVNLQGAITGGETLTRGTAINLIAKPAGELITTDTTLSGKATLKQGISLNHTLALQTSGTGIDAIIQNTTVNPATGIFTNGRLATLSFLNQGTDFALDSGMTKALETIRARGIGVYGAVSGSDIRQDFDKSGDADITGTHWLLGITGKLNPEKEYDLIGNLYTEAGWGNLDSDNSLASGHGDTHYYGIGLIGRYRQNEGAMKGLWAQINAKVGRVSTDFESNLYDINGNRGEYDKKATYYGAGIGIGYLWDITNTYQLDLHARYQWLHLNGYSADIASDPYRFDDIDSHRSRIGARLNITENKQYTPYLGLAWEHEFSGTAKGNVYGHSLDDNSLKGDTGIGEIGISFRPEADSPWKVDAGITGYLGAREGVAGHFVLNYLF